MFSESLHSSASGWPMPPLAPSTATFVDLKRRPTREAVESVRRAVAMFTVLFSVMNVGIDE